MYQQNSSRRTRFIKILSSPRNHFNEEFKDLRDYIYNTMYKKCPIHIGNPNRMGLNRIYALDLAKEIGLKVPEYAVITNYNQLTELNNISDKFVSKAISNGIYDFLGMMHIILILKLGTKQTLPIKI